MVCQGLTPPGSSVPGMDLQHPHELTPENSSDHDSLRLIGTTRFPPLDDVKTIFITGGAGFIGSWVTRHLTVRYPEYKIICYDKLDEVSSLANIRCLDTFPNFHFHQGDLNDERVVSRLLSEYNVDCVMHFAACSHVQNSFDSPCTFTLNNVVGTQRLLDAVRHYGGVRRFVHVSTDEVYGEAMEESIDETKQFMPTNPYSASKAAAEMYVWAYAKSFNIPALVVRSNNVYGPCQYPEKIIPRFYTLLSSNQPLTIQGSGLNIRRYLYAADAADGFDTLLHKGALGESYNLNSTSAVSNLEVAVRMLELFNLSPQHDFHNRLVWTEDRPFDDHDYYVSGEKLEALGWRQRVPFTQGLRDTVEWYRGNMLDWWPGFTEGVSAGVGDTSAAIHGEEFLKEVEREKRGYGYVCEKVGRGDASDSGVEMSGSSSPVVVSPEG